MPKHPRRGRIPLRIITVMGITMTIGTTTTTTMDMGTGTGTGTGMITGTARMRDWGSPSG